MEDEKQLKETDREMGKRLFPNTPQFGEVRPVSEATRRLYFENQMVTLPCRPGLRKFSPGRRFECKIGVLNREIGDQLALAFSCGEDYKATIQWAKGILRAYNTNQAFLDQFEEQESKLYETNSVVEHETVIKAIRKLCVTELSPEPGEGETNEFSLNEGAVE